jgi:8-oxo-dGTP diphosphatase
MTTRIKTDRGRYVFRKLLEPQRRHYVRVSMKHSAKLVLAKGSHVLMVKRTKDGLWTLPGGKQRRFENSKECLLREVGEELPQVRLRRVRRWKELQCKTSKGKTRQVVYRAHYAGGTLEIGDTSELIKAKWRDPGQTRLAPSADTIARKLLGRR